MLVRSMGGVGTVLVSVIGSAGTPMLIWAEPAVEVVQRAPATVESRLTAVQLPALGEIGYAGLYAGVSNGVLIAAGGTNFPDAPPWKQGKKVWYDRIWVLEPGTEAWRDAGVLDRARALGASLTLPEGVLCIGGGDEKDVFADVFLLRYDSTTRAVTREDWPALPRPVMACSSAVAGGRVYVVGGHEQTAALAGDGPLTEVWSIDPSDRAAGWRNEPSIPSAGRFLPVVAGDEDHLYVLSGMARGHTPDGDASLHCTPQVWRLTLTTGRWDRLPDLPRANAAAPSPAPIVDGQILLLGGGVDDSNFGGPMELRPGFPATVLAVDIATRAAREIGQVRSSVVAASVAPWDGGHVVVSGEIKAGVRSPEVWVYYLLETPRGR